MPMLIEYIDAIARQKQRDVLFVTFHAAKADPRDEWGCSYDWENDPVRAPFCEWLTAHGIAWQCCAGVADENYMGPYEGGIYVDVPFDEVNPLYVLVRDYLENPDGSMKFETVSFWVLPLEKAMENAHHDEPRFWEQWAKDF